MPRILVIGNQTLGSKELRAALEERAGPDTVIHIVVPQTPLDHYRSAVDGHDETVAEHQLADALADLADLEATVTGVVGDPDPLMAATVVGDQWGPDEALLTTFEEGASRWLRASVPERLARLLEVPVTHVIGKTWDEDRKRAVKYAALRREMGLADGAASDGA